MTTTNSRPSIPGLVRRWRQSLDKSKASERGAERRAARPSDGYGDPQEQRQWLTTALQAAVTLEFATIPPYLCALWSVKDDLHPVAKSIREIVQEEMLHMALTCNMLAALGETPRITEAFAPTYPAPLPGKVHPGLVVKLAGLSRASLKTFLTIERPSVFPQNVEQDAEDRVQPDRTIGAFYDCILRAFQQLKPSLSTDRQITGPLVWMTIANLDNVAKAINDVIKQQGEGAESGPLDTNRDDYAHYYRFKEIYRRKRLVFDEAGEKYVYRERIAWPDVWPMAPVPKGGWGAGKNKVSRKVGDWLEGFDETYSELLRLLENAWTRGGQASFVAAIDKMFELEKFAKPLMQTPISGTAGRTRRHYGPCFRYRAAAG
jgi:hypothetical protein